MKFNQVITNDQVNFIAEYESDVSRVSLSRRVESSSWWLAIVKHDLCVVQIIDGVIFFKQKCNFNVNDINARIYTRMDQFGQVYSKVVVNDSEWNRITNN